MKSSKRAGAIWGSNLSCEFLGYYKPSLQAYITAVRYIGIVPEEVMMVAAHESDLIAPISVGDFFSTTRHADSIKPSFNAL